MRSRARAEVLLICRHSAWSCLENAGCDEDVADAMRGVTVVRVEAHPPVEQLSSIRAAGRVEAAGGVVRVGEAAACSMLVVDRRIAVVSGQRTTDRDGVAGAGLFTDPPVVRAYLALARDHLYRSWPTSLLPEDGRLPGPSPIERRVLSLLCSCTTDLEVARRLGITDRQLRRYIRSLELRLGVRSRFQLGARCAELGWAQQFSPPVSGSGHRPADSMAHGHRPVP